MPFQSCCIPHRPPDQWLRIGKVARGCDRRREFAPAAAGGAPVARALPEGQDWWWSRAAACPRQKTCRGRVRVSRRRSSSDYPLPNKGASDGEVHVHLPGRRLRDPECPVTERDPATPGALERLDE